MKMHEWDNIEKTFRNDYYNPLVIRTNMKECEKISENIFKVSNYTNLFLKCDGEYTGADVEYYKDGKMQ
jgi:hypothetical protein